jgi:hypothetical protein
MNPARFRWGVLFILVGGLLLLNNMDRLDWWVWADILSLWPLILIAIGVEKIFNRTRLQIIAYLAPVALAAVVIWVAVDGFSGGDERLTRQGSTYRYAVESDPSVNRIQATFDMGDIDLTLGSTGSKLFRVRADQWRRVPDVSSEIRNGEADIRLSPKRGRLAGWMRVDRWGQADEWDAYLLDNVPINLKCRGGESDMVLDCRSLKLEQLAVISDQGDIRIQVGDAVDKVALKLEGDNGDFRVLVPRDCGLRVTGAGAGLTHLLERIGLGPSGTAFATGGYDTLVPKIELELSPEITQFSLDYY